MAPGVGEGTGGQRRCAEDTDRQDRGAAAPGLAVLDHGGVQEVVVGRLVRLPGEVPGIDPAVLGWYGILEATGERVRTVGILGHRADVDEHRLLDTLVDVSEGQQGLDAVRGGFPGVIPPVVGQHGVDRNRTCVSAGVHPRERFGGHRGRKRHRRCVFRIEQPALFLDGDRHRSIRQEQMGVRCVFRVSAVEGELVLGCLCGSTDGHGVGPAVEDPEGVQDVEHGPGRADLHDELIMPGVAVTGRVGVTDRPDAVGLHRVAEHHGAVAGTADQFDFPCVALRVDHIDLSGHQRGRVRLLDRVNPG